MNKKQLARRTAFQQVSLKELPTTLPEGLRRVFDKKGIPDKGIGRYSIQNEIVRLYGYMKER